MHFKTEYRDVMWRTWRPFPYTYGYDAPSRTPIPTNKCAVQVNLVLIPQNLQKYLSFSSLSVQEKSDVKFVSEGFIDANLSVFFVCTS